MKDVTALTNAELAEKLRAAADLLTGGATHELAAATARAAMVLEQQETVATQRQGPHDLAWQRSAGGFVPAGHLLRDTDSPLVRLMMRNLGAAYVGEGRKANGWRKTLSELLLERHGDGHDGANLHELAEHAIESLPAEIVILRGGCGGETTHACYTLEGYEAAFKRFSEFWGEEDDVMDPAWPIVERIPVVKR